MITVYTDDGNSERCRKVRRNRCRPVGVCTACLALVRRLELLASVERQECEEGRPGQSGLRQEMIGGVVGTAWRGSLATEQTAFRQWRILSNRLFKARD